VRRLSTRALAVVLLLVAVAPRRGYASEEEDEAPRGRGIHDWSVDPNAISGKPVRYGTRPIFAPDVRSCSTRLPICIHARSSGDARTSLVALGALERAWETLTGALEIPAPDVDETTLAYDVFLTDALGAGRALFETELEARDVRSRFDRARTFTLLDRRVAAAGEKSCLLEVVAARAIARASLFRVAPATEEGTARAQSAYLSELVAPCGIGLAVDEIGAFQARPEDALADAHVGGGPPLDALFSHGSAAFWARLDWAFGRSPGAVVTATWALHPTVTPVGAARWNNRPDTFDVLRTSFKGALSTGSTVADLWLDFGIARAFLGSADDGLHEPELRGVGDAARIVPDWDIPWPRTPRRLAARRGVAPTGASYVVVRRAGAAPNARLRAEIEWEEHALFRWAFVKVDANGREMGRVLIPTTERATSAQMTLVGLDGVDRVLLVGVNVGDPAYAFDPDDEAWEPHGWLVTLAEEPQD
jgi:hypothetical protein